MSTFDQIPEGLVLEILYRLPPKSVYRFKSVSKMWKNLITEPSFMQSYLAISSAWTLISRFDSIVGYRDIPDDYKGVHFITPQLSNYPLDTIPRCQGRNYLIASSGDLLLFNGTPSGWNVCNPFTEQWIELPPKPRRRNGGSWGIGFISRVQDGVAQYKVVIITGTSYAGPPGYEGRGRNVLRLTTFCSEIGERRNSKVSLPDYVRLETPFWSCFSFNGAIHWIEHRQGIMVAYNPSTNECRLIKMPTDFNWLNGINMVVNVCQGRIRCFEVSTYGLPPQELGSWSLWVLEDCDKGKWRLEHNGDERKVCSLDALPEVHPLDLDILCFRCDGHILPYSLRTGFFETGGYLIPSSGWLIWWDIFPVMVPSRLLPAAQPRRRNITGRTAMAFKGKKMKIEKLLKYLPALGKQK